ncbi:DUF3667 domain-containing protein [Flavobacterium humi]|uniref:DUF3667 domain-containing protein n=1 Tax=Flavobacterium humi TaxID=2562683 RepID=A0A4Z0L4U3_9FLAO|nr:DUF3667 domain-containing protein [Flavobacterium humi]TGD57264.1 DUF3667 domain-containing protein [Flavobacterium humi]
MSHSTLCLNCNHLASDKFCSHCGQKTDTHRITLKHFLFHDILHGIWHFEKGILFTVKEALVRPGKAALDYIAGKRIRYYNVFYLVLILIGLTLFMSHYHDSLSEVYIASETKAENNATGNKIASFMSSYAKVILFSFIPLFACNSLMLFRRKKLNISEHFIVAGMVFLGVMLITVFGQALSFLDFTYLDVVSVFLDFMTPVAILAYTVYSYFSAFRSDYPVWSFGWRMVLFIVLIGIELIIFFVLLVGFVTHWKYGSISYHG